MIDKEGKLTHSTCPHCGSTNTYWNDSQADPDDSGSRFYMKCDGCGKDYTAVHKYAYSCWESDEEDV